MALFRRCLEAGLCSIAVIRLNLEGRLRAAVFVQNWGLIRPNPRGKRKALGASRSFSGHWRSFGCKSPYPKPAI